MSKGRKKIRFSGRDGDKLSFTKGDEPWTTVQAVSVHDAENLETWLNEKNTKRITLPERFRLDAAMRVLDSVDKMLAFYFWRTRIEQIVRNAVEGEPWLRG